jgi:hypothetical protein
MLPEFGMVELVEQREIDGVREQEFLDRILEQQQLSRVQVLAVEGEVDV